MHGHRSETRFTLVYPCRSLFSVGQHCHQSTAGTAGHRAEADSTLGGTVLSRLVGVLCSIANVLPQTGPALTFLQAIRLWV